MIALPCPISTTTRPAQNTPVPAQSMQKKDAAPEQISAIDFWLSCTGENPHRMSMIANED
jgi:hypothetical protein